MLAQRAVTQKRSRESGVRNWRVTDHRAASGQRCWQSEALLLRMWVERVAQPVAEEGEAQHRQRDRDPRQDNHTWEAEDRVEALVDHRAPTRHWRRRADANKAQRRLQQDVL